LKKVAEFESTIESAAEHRAPHRLTNYIQDLAAAFHKFYNAEKVLTDDTEKTKAHVAPTMVSPTRACATSFWPTPAP
ncbi:hypothetical protein J8J22_23935, partial [Mycobacterium tuberculosis]|nr:hypothetical protein [Mycobacterium tuberculosis]